jgi:sugar (pentulose or hexulose) kinase
VKIKTKYIAVDIGKRNRKACIMNADGSNAEESEYDKNLLKLKYLLSRCLKNMANV